MIQLAGEEQFSQELPVVWERLTDVGFIAQATPGLDRIESAEEDLLVCRVRPGLSFVKGTLKVTVEIFDKRPPSAVQIRIHSKGIGSTATVVTSVGLSADQQLA